MAERDSTNTLSQDVTDVVFHSYHIEAILAGALALLEDCDDELEAKDRVFNARQLIEIAKDKTAKIYLDADDLRIVSRAIKLEEAVVCHD